MKRLLREPLLHFLVLGAALFGLFALRGDPKQRTERIVIGAGQVEHLASSFARTWMRPPTPEELDGLVQDYLREEVASREAMAMQLDRDDTIVRRRLRQKLEFLSEDLAALAPPSEQELQDYLREHPDSFRREPRIAFRHVFVSREQRGESAQADARAILARLASSAADADVAELGDPTLLPGELELASATEIDGLFGRGFAGALEKLEPGRWSGPLESSYGLHLVLVTASEPGRLPELAEVHDEVTREWSAAHGKEALDAFYRELFARYEVVVESAQPVPGASAPAAQGQGATQ